jgi:cytochrome d ubiquinol oxidase subunit II
VNVLAFGLVAFMLAVYVLLDGYDLGVAAMTPLLARGDAEKRAAMQSIGPFWNGNEVWLIAAGGVLFALFPQGYATAFSGFYLPFMIVLWLLMGRGVALELREHFPSEMWHQFWDAMFAVASVLLILLFGVALGNLLRGVPLDAQGYFLGTFAFLLNWYALLVGMFGLLVLATHGTAFLAVRVEGALADRARAMLPQAWIAVLAFFIAVTAATFLVRAGAPPAPWVYVASAGALGMLGWMRAAMAMRRDKQVFAASCAFVGLLLVTVAGTLYPYLIPAYPAGHGGLSIFAASPPPVALASALGVSIVGLLAVIVYGALVWRKLAGKVRVGE